jgi:hypothetical protein
VMTRKDNVEACPNVISKTCRGRHLHNSTKQFKLRHCDMLKENIRRP